MQDVQDMPVVVMQMDLEVQGGRIGLVPPTQPGKGLRRQVTLGRGNSIGDICLQVLTLSIRWYWFIRYYEVSGSAEG